MTLIASWIEQGIPILIGDVLTSASGIKLLNQNRIPTRDDIQILLPPDWGTLINTCQKVYLICDNLCLAWAGTLVSARGIVKLLYEWFDGRTATLESLKQNLCSLDAEKNACIIIGWIVENQKAYGFRWKSSDPTIFEMGNSFVEGTGRKDFINSSSGNYKGGSPVEYAIARISKLLQEEVLHGTNLWSLYGGSFTIAHWSITKFEFVPSVTYIFSQFKETQEDGEIIGGTAPRNLKYQHGQELLQIMAMLNDEETTGHHKIAPQKPAGIEMHFVPTLISKPGRYFVPNNLSLESVYYSISFDIMLRDQIPELGNDKSMTIRGGLVNLRERAKWIQINKAPGNIEWMTITNEFFNHLFELLTSLDRKTLIPQYIEYLKNVGYLKK